MAEKADSDWVSKFKIDRARQKHASRKKWWLLALGLLVALLLVLLLLRPPTVTITQVREAQPGEAATELSAAGFVAAQRRSIVAPKYAGRLDEVAVEEGDSVAQGQVLARLDDSEARVSVQQAQAAVQAAQATVAAIAAESRKSEIDWKRAQRLWKASAISHQQLQDALATRNTAQANKRAALGHLNEARKELEGARLRLDSTTIRAPFAGTVAKKLADEGAVLAPAALEEPNTGGIVELVDLESLEVEAEVSENEITRIKKGQPALIFLDAFPDRVYRATAGTVRPTIDRSKATAVVKIEFRGETSGILPDMGAKGSFLNNELSEEVLQKEARLRVSATAVVNREGRQVVLVVENGKVREYAVQIEQQVGTEVALAAGPKPGTPVVAVPGPRLQEGSRVKVSTEGT